MGLQSKGMTKGGETFKNLETTEKIVIPEASAGDTSDTREIAIDANGNLLVATDTSE